MTRLILKHLMSDEDYATKVYPFLKSDYFDNKDENYLYKVISKYQDKYGMFPSFNEVEVLIQKNPDDDDRTRLEKVMSKIREETELESNQFLYDESEEYIRNKDLQLSIMEAVEILQSENKIKTAGIPSLIEDSLAICFDKEIGLDFNTTLSERLEYYKKQDTSGYKTDLDIINQLTNGGFKNKTLSIIVGAPHSGKSLFMTHLSTSFLLHGHNVLYITLEMSEHEIAKRIDSNLLSIDINELKFANEDEFVSKYKSILSGGLGRLIVKEYPTAGANAIHFKSLLKELKQKQNFRADVIVVDYLGIMGAVSDQMYENIKKNAESLRALAVEFDCAVITGSQTNRQGFDRNNGIAMSDIAESTGPLQIADLVLGVSKFESGVEENSQEDGSGINKIMEQQVLVNTIKNRMGGLTKDKFLLTQKFKFMRLEDNTELTYHTPKHEKEVPADKFNVSANAIFKNNQVFDF